MVLFQVIVQFIGASRVQYRQLTSHVLENVYTFHWVKSFLPYQMMFDILYLFYLSKNLSWDLLLAVNPECRPAEMFSPCRELSDTITLSPLLWNHNRHVVHHLLALLVLNQVHLTALAPMWKNSSDLPQSVFDVWVWQVQQEKKILLGAKCFLFCLSFVLSLPSFCLCFCWCLMLRGW